MDYTVHTLNTALPVDVAARQHALSGSWPVFLGNQQILLGELLWFAAGNTFSLELLAPDTGLNLTVRLSLDAKILPTPCLVTCKADLETSTFNAKVIVAALNGVHVLEFFSDPETPGGRLGTDSLTHLATVPSCVVALNPMLVLLGYSDGLRILNPSRLGAIPEAIGTQNEILCLAVLSDNVSTLAAAVTSNGQVRFLSVEQVKDDICARVKDNICDPTFPCGARRVHHANICLVRTPLSEVVTCFVTLEGDNLCELVVLQLSPSAGLAQYHSADLREIMPTDATEATLNYNPDAPVTQLIGTSYGLLVCRGDDRIHSYHFGADSPVVQTYSPLRDGDNSFGYCALRNIASFGIMTRTAVHALPQPDGTTAVPPAPIDIAIALNPLAPTDIAPVFGRYALAQAVSEETTSLLECASSIVEHAYLSGLGPVQHIANICSTPSGVASLEQLCRDLATAPSAVLQNSYDVPKSAFAIGRVLLAALRQRIFLRLDSIRNVIGLLVKLQSFRLANVTSSSQLRRTARKWLQPLSTMKLQFEVLAELPDTVLNIFLSNSLTERAPDPVSCALQKLWVTNDEPESWTVASAKVARVAAQILHTQQWHALRSFTSRFLPLANGLEHFYAFSFLTPQSFDHRRAVSQWSFTAENFENLDSQTQEEILTSIGGSQRCNGQPLARSVYIAAMLAFLGTNLDGDPATVRNFVRQQPSVLCCFPPQALSVLNPSLASPVLDCFLSALINDEDWAGAHAWLAAQVEDISQAEVTGELRESVIRGTDRLIEAFCQHGTEGMRHFQDLGWDVGLLPLVAWRLWIKAENTGAAALMAQNRDGNGLPRCNFYKFLYAFLTRRDDKQSAAHAMYRLAERLQVETAKAEGIDPLRTWAATGESLLLCTSALAQLPEDRAYFGRVSNCPCDPFTDLSVSSPFLKDGYEVIVTLEQVRQKLLRTSAELQLAQCPPPEPLGVASLDPTLPVRRPQPQPLFHLATMRVEDLVVLLADAELLTLAVDVCRAFNLLAAPQVGHIIASLARCCHLADGGEGEKLWDLLKELLTLLPASAHLHEKALTSMLASGPWRNPPDWLVRHVQRSNPNAVLHAYTAAARKFAANQDVKRKLLNAATEIASEYLEWRLHSEIHDNAQYLAPVTAAQLDELVSLLDAPHREKIRSLLLRMRCPN
eukprot:TRINITY_DN14076_c0_g1_i1.p1 TRINITY_DN14076_c0_g1~~TRINITY_DN14076_c0_g1_i1.p1  ORF type:complete len:1179 (-),score=122.20 TRINITY_DN14076_c0_g1_i1:51-3557(-)